MTLEEIMNWLNSNTGVVAVILFAATIGTGWLSGIFKAIIKRPRFKIRVIPKMTFGTVFLTGGKYTPPTLGTYDVHKTAFVIYLEITNRGTAPSMLGKVQIGYYKDDGKSTLFQKRLWIKETNVLDDFSISTGTGKAIGIPHLKQANPQIDKTYNGFLEIGNSIIGAAYFEQSSRWGNHYSRVDDSRMTEIKIVVKDAFGNRYSKKVKVKIIELKDALRYNSKFGFTEHFFDKQMEDLQIEREKEEKGGYTEEGVESEI